MSIATLILAAGSSSRLGGDLKQLVLHNDKPLIWHVAQAALALQCGPVLVVLGANANRIRDAVEDLALSTPVNANWPEGMASSLRAGLLALADEPADAFIVLLTDQPYVTTNLLQQLIDTQQQTGRGIVACRYAEGGPLGVPALFDMRYRSEFMQLTGDTGARKLINYYAADCAEVWFPKGLVDLDTQQDLLTWREQEARNQTKTL